RHDALPDLGEPLTARRPRLRGARPPGGQPLAVVRLDLPRQAALPLALADLDEPHVGDVRHAPALSAGRDGAANRGGRVRRARERGVDDRQRPALGDGQRRRIVGASESGGDPLGLTTTGGGQGRVEPPLEAALDDQLRLPVPNEDERRIQAIRDREPHVRAAAVVRPGLRVRQRSRPSRIVHSSTTDSWVRIASSTLSGTSSSRARIIRASARGALRPTCIALMFTSAAPRVWPMRPMSRRYSFNRVRRISPPATVPATVVVRPPVSPERLSCAEKPPASGVLRSTTVIPRALARAAAL